MSILGPAFLVNSINLTALIIAVVILVYFGSFVHHKIVLPIADLARKKSQHKIGEIRQVKKRAWIMKYLPESLATIVFILYCYFGAIILAEYIFAPILYRLRGIIVIAVIALFFVISYGINNIRLRKKFMGM